jgi:carboxymethylenebutenolidase
MGETIAVGSTEAYLATPDMGAGPAVLVITEPADTKRRESVCDEFAAEGFTALGPELRDGHTAGDLTAAVEVLKPHPAVRGQGIGVVGFGAGSALAEWLGTQRPDDVVAVVSFDEAEDERLVWIRTLEYLRKNLG